MKQASCCNVPVAGTGLERASKLLLGRKTEFRWWIISAKPYLLKGPRFAKHLAFPPSRHSPLVDWFHRSFLSDGVRGEVSQMASFRVGDDPGVEGLRSTQRRLSRPIVEDGLNLLQFCEAARHLYGKGVYRQSARRAETRADYSTLADKAGAISRSAVRTAKRRADPAHHPSFILRSRAANRGSPRMGSKCPKLRIIIMFWSRSSTARSNHSKAGSISPRP